MGKVKSFLLLLHDNKSVYYPGETVKGICELRIKDFVKVSLVSIELAGLGKVFWTETRSSGTRLGPITENFRSEVEYVRAKQELPFQIDRSESEGGETRHAYSFSFTLPTNLVTSFEGKFGYVRYFLKADLVRPWPRAISVKKYITVIKPIDTNNPQYQRSIAATDENEICCFCCQSGTVHVTAQTDRVAYCPGESVAITARFYNNSIRTVKPYAVLCQTQKFHAKGLTQTVTYRLAMLTGLPLKGRQSAVWDCQLVRLPPVSPSILNSALIEVHYCIKVGLVVPWCRDISVTLPIVVGTVPFRLVRPLSAVGPNPANANGVSASPPSYHALSLGPPRPALQQETSCSSEYSYSDPPPTYVESFLAGGYLTDDENEQYTVDEGDEDEDEDEDNFVAEVDTNVNSRRSLRSSSRTRCVSPQSRNNALNSHIDTSRSITEPVRQDGAHTNTSWWRHSARSSTGAGMQQLNRSRRIRRNSPHFSNSRRFVNNSAPQMPVDEIASTSNQQLPGARRFMPLIPYVSYPPPPSYTEVMGTVAETSH